MTCFNPCSYAWKVADNLNSRLLVHHPRVMNRLRGEIASVLARKSELNREDLKKMTYLSYVLKEGMSPSFSKPWYDLRGL